MFVAAPPPRQEGHGYGDGKNNHNFWTLLKSEYLEQLDNNVLAAII